jgi:Coproporphyrinogen III oxidase and related Fe-S oxidoreductases
MKQHATDMKSHRDISSNWSVFSKRTLHPWLDHRHQFAENIDSTYDGLIRGVPDSKRLAYLHVPFCANRCLFCGFYREHTDGAMQRTYVEHLLADIARDGRRLAGSEAPIQAVFLGGGTPSALEAADLARLIRALRDHLPLAPDCEITVEGRVMGFSPDKVAAIVEAGANRVSIGIQTFDTRLRRRLGRHADRAGAIDFLSSLRRIDGLTVVCDLIYGLPGQTEEMWRSDIATCVALGLDGVDLYCLTLHEDSPLAAAIAKETMPPPGDLDQALRFYVLGGELLERAGWRRISQAHWAGSPRERNIYNQLSKDGADCLAFGAGAGGMLAGHRFMLDGSRESYQRRVAAGEKPIALMTLPSPHTAARNAIMTAMEDGVLPPDRFERLVGPGFAAAIEPLLSQWRESGLIVPDGAGLRLSAAGRFWHNNLAAALFRSVSLHLDGESPVMTSAMAHPHGHGERPPAAHPHGVRPMPFDDKGNRLAALRQRFAESTDGILEEIAATNGLSTREVCNCLPADSWNSAPGSRFVEAMDDISGWGTVTVLVHTRDIILECKASLPRGAVARGFFNLMGSGPLSGHIHHDHCAAIYFLKRHFMGQETRAVVFFNEDGEPIFKIFVGRDEKRALLADQVNRFEALRTSLSAA